jgi:hypothetical protein
MEPAPNDPAATAQIQARGPVLQGEHGGDSAVIEQRELDLRLLTATHFAKEVPCDESTLRKALNSQPISVRKAHEIVQALRRLQAELCGVLAGLLGVSS